GSTVRGLVINRFPGYGINLNASGGNSIEGNFLGTDTTGTASLSNSADGIFMDNAASNTVGGTKPDARNVISGNRSRGLFITGTATIGNLVEGNYIGISAAGNSALGNSAGMQIDFGASATTIGGTTPGARNVISGNISDGVQIISGLTPTDNL